MSSTKESVAKGIIIAAIPVIVIVLFFRGLFSLADFKSPRTFQMTQRQARQNRLYCPKSPNMSTAMA